MNGKNSLTGAWKLIKSPHEEVLLFADGYFSQTAFNKDEEAILFYTGRILRGSI